MVPVPSSSLLEKCGVLTLLKQQPVDWDMTQILIGINKKPIHAGQQWHEPLISALERQRPAGVYEFKPSLVNKS